MAVKKSQLYASIWTACNAMRGGVEPSKYKDYILTLLFVKYLTDKCKRSPSAHYTIPAGSSYDDLLSLRCDAHLAENIDMALERLKGSNPLLDSVSLPYYNDETFGRGQAKADTLWQMLKAFDKPELDLSNNRLDDDDLLGDAYEYLMANFAVESGKSKGQFYTPAEVSRLMAKLLHLSEMTKARETIYDPTCGSGSLLLRAWAEAGKKPTLYGQEKETSTASLARLNTLIHGAVTAEIANGDTLRAPHYTAGANLLKTFDVCVANPPFSQKLWRSAESTHDRYLRWEPDAVPPESCGDYAFLLHLITSMKPETGRGACILPHGVLFRGQVEATIRRDLVERRIIKGIIGLPANVFYGTGIPACIVVIDKSGVGARRGIFFIDAKDGYAKEGAKNRLREQDIRRISDVWQAEQDVPHYAHLATWAEIAGNEWNLNIARYVEPLDTVEHHDLSAHFLGGIPERDVAQLEGYWRACPTLRDALLITRADGRYDLRPSPDALPAAIAQEASYQDASLTFDAHLEEWLRHVRPLMEHFAPGDKPREALKPWADCLLEHLNGLDLIDHYDVYQLLLDQWNTVINDDLHYISQSGWRRAEIWLTPPNREGKRHRLPCADSLVPMWLVEEEWFSEQLRDLEAMRASLEEAKASFAECNDAEVIDTYLSTPETAEGTKVNKSTLERLLRRPALPPEQRQAAERWLKWRDELTQVTKSVKEYEELLDGEIAGRYASLTEAEIRPLVVGRKWLAPMLKGVEELRHASAQRLASALANSARRYQHTCHEVCRQAARDEQRALNLLNEVCYG